MLCTMTRTLLITAALALALPQSAAAVTPVAGQHYRVMDPPIATEVAPGKVEVIEFFSLGCPHCAEFEPYLQAWLRKKPANVEFRRVPAVFNPMFRLLARVHLALEDLGAAERIDPLLLEAIHGRQKDVDVIRPLGEWQNRMQRGEEAAAVAAEKDLFAAMGTFVAARGVDRKKFEAALNSPSNMIKLGRAEATFRRYGVLGVPGIAVNGKYFTSAGRPFVMKDYGEIADVVVALVEMESKKKR